ncbi:MAG: hypothetical protein P8Z70_02755 [Desulfuromonadales bacterium]|jgi:hypothetical protein
MAPLLFAIDNLFGIVSKKADQETFLFHQGFKYEKSILGTNGSNFSRRSGTFLPVGDGWRPVVLVDASAFILVGSDIPDGHHRPGIVVLQQLPSEPG